MGQQLILELLRENTRGLTAGELNIFLKRSTKSSIYKQLTQLTRYNLILKVAEKRSNRNVLTYVYYYIQTDEDKKAWKKQ